ncbi:MAG: bifunctional methylenetetrahydrofolate dehydrogenase/methenyltetrahydrofolate cyclohydrolase FolD [Deltaproteobacteria bacterium]|nr:bifunctional methylenetetrahydrofolate dehydrogenase/methenyltetrahydrofolate cyclohydrolase FolD [Deltaproteobacteria bacterium]
MSAKLIDGKAVAEKVMSEVARGVERLKKEKKIIPGLAAVLVGDNEASKIYVRNKRIACEKVGIYSTQELLPGTASEEELLGLIDNLNKDPMIHGILVQLPLPSSMTNGNPSGMNVQKILSEVAPEKDVDGFHPINLGKLFSGMPDMVPCTPAGIIKLLESINFDFNGKEAVIVGRSNIVGKPIALLLMQRHATVTICHSQTKNLSEKVKRGDLVVAALGKPALIQEDWIKPGAVVIDVGMNRLPNGKLVGDVDPKAASKASFITPVPGGVGPMTIAMLLSNTLEAARRQSS